MINHNYWIKFLYLRVEPIFVLTIGT